MKKTNQETTKKIAVFAGLLAAGALAVTGICLCLHKEEPVSLIAENEEAPVEKQQIDMQIASPSPVPSTEEDTAVSTDIIISTEIEPESRGEELVQPLQQEPVKTETEKPTDPPAEAVAANDPNDPPENKEIPAQATPQPGNNSSTPQHGSIQDGKIYIDGFGWIDYNGGATEVIQGDGIYENGNKIGIMD
ncbi:MAG: hypothetical protein NC123_19010 [Butyrivibrio sp.]|nr:hypothetical protein [Butyrivibrio sp.]